MDLKGINSLLSTLLADSSTNFYTTNERLQAINSACSYLNSELRILRNVATITITPLDPTVPIPQDFVSLGSGMQWDDGNTLTSLNRAVPNQLQSGLSTSWSTDTGTPATYVMEGGRIYLTPRPTKTGRLIMSYISMPNKLLDDYDLPFYGDPRIQAYHDIIAYYAAWQLCLKDRDFEAAQQFMGWFQNRTIDLKENLRHTGDVSVQPVWSDVYSTV